MNIRNDCSDGRTLTRLCALLISRPNADWCSWHCRNGNECMTSRAVGIDCFFGIQQDLFVPLTVGSITRRGGRASLNAMESFPMASLGHFAWASATVPWKGITKPWSISSWSKLLAISWVSSAERQFCKWMERSWSWGLWSLGIGEKTWLDGMSWSIPVGTPANRAGQRSWSGSRISLARDCKADRQNGCPLGTPQSTVSPLVLKTKDSNDARNGARSSSLKGKDESGMEKRCASFWCRLLETIRFIQVERRGLNTLLDSWGILQSGEDPTPPPSTCACGMASNAFSGMRRNASSIVIVAPDWQRRATIWAKSCARWAGYSAVWRLAY